MDSGGPTVAYSASKGRRRPPSSASRTRQVVPLPYRQQDIADALGLSLVHTNKTLAWLRENGLATWQGGMLTVEDTARLAEVALAEVDPPERRPLM